MNVSRPAMHPVEAPQPTDGDGANNALRLRIKDVQGMPGTPGGLALRICQFVFAAVSLCVMVTTSDFPNVTAFCYLVAAVGLQSLWSLLLAVVDIYALLVRQSLRNPRVVSVFTIGDGLSNFFIASAQLLITSTLTFVAACASTGITVLIGNDLNECAVNHCARFESATTMAFLSMLFIKFHVVWDSQSSILSLTSALQISNLAFALSPFRETASLKTLYP